MNDLIRLACERAVDAFGGPPVFNGAGFAQAFRTLAGTDGLLDGRVVRALLTGRADVQPLSGGSHYALVAAAAGETGRTRIRRQTAEMRQQTMALIDQWPTPDRVAAAESPEDQAQRLRVARRVVLARRKGRPAELPVVAILHGRDGYLQFMTSECLTLEPPERFYECYEVLYDYVPQLAAPASVTAPTPAPLIVFEGIDGSGKGTQTEQLERRLAATGVRVARRSFPMYGRTVGGRLAGRFLDGEFGSLQAVHPLLAALPFMLDRAEAREELRVLREQFDVVLCDRYVASNVAHQVAKFADPEVRADAAAVLSDLEYRVLGAAQATLTICLMPTLEVAQANIAAKAQRAYTDKAADLHEADPEYLEAVFRVYAELALQPDWRAIRTVQDGQQLSVGAIGEQIYQAVCDCLPALAH